MSVISYTLEAKAFLSNLVRQGYEISEFGDEKQLASKDGIPRYVIERRMFKSNSKAPSSFDVKFRVTDLKTDEIVYIDEKK